MHCDNKSVIAIASNLVFYNRTKHIDVYCHTTRQAHEKRIVSLPKHHLGPSLRTFSRRHRLLLSSAKYFPNSQCMTYHEFEGGWGCGGVKICLYSLHLSCQLFLFSPPLFLITSFPVYFPLVSIYICVTSL